MSSINNHAADLTLSIKATAMNKDRARVWIESAAIQAYGFTRHARYDLQIFPDAISIKLDPNGSRAVAGRVRNGRAISILDICMPCAQRDSVRGSASTFSVSVSDGLIVIKAGE